MIKMSPSLLVLAATLLVFAQTPRTGMVQSVTRACMAVFGEEEGVQMNSAIDQNLIRYTTTACHTVPAKRTSNHRPGYFFIANAKAHPAGGIDTQGGQNGGHGTPTAPGGREL